jgi:hypothetical protein
VECLSPVMSWHRVLKQQRVDHIIDDAKSTLGFTVLRRGVWAGHPQDDTIEGKECTGGGIIELMTVVTLDNLDGVAKLHGNKGKKIDNVGKVSDFTLKGKVHIKCE